MKSKIAAVFTAIVCALPFSVHADEFENKPVISVNAGYGAENDIAEVDINVEKNMGMSAYSIEIDFDPRVLTFVDAVQGSAFSGGVFYCNGDYSDDAVRIVWSDSRNKKGDGTAAVLRFKTAYGSAGTATPVSIGYTVIADDMKEADFTANDGELIITGEITEGDINCDGEISVSDVVLLNMYLLNGQQNPLSYESQANSDVTGDKRITSADSAHLMNYISMKIEEF